VTAAALIAAAVLGAQSPDARPFDVASGPAPQSINRAAAQAGVDVVITIDLAGRQTPALHGRMVPGAAFERLLRPLGARAVRLRDGVYRIEAAPPPRRLPPQAPQIPEPAATALSEIIVTAVPPVGLAGASGRTIVDPPALQRVEGQSSSEAIADLSATVDSTRQGTGRNKLFVRGLADSALNGPLQATVGQYLGGLRLNYGSPDPDLALIDIRRIEVFEGPQGTRFGAGSIGGILRLDPQPPEPGVTHGRINAGAGVTSGGAASGDLSLILNRPIGDRTAMRFVTYARREGGFLANPAQGGRYRDGVETTGGRAALRWVGDTWTVDVTGVAQRVASADTQTVAASGKRFVKTSSVAEPYGSSLALAGLTARREFSRGRISAATSISRQSLDERFDATQPSEAFPALVDRRQTTVTSASELRLDLDPAAGLALSGGAAVVIGDTRASRRRRSLSPDPAPAAGVDLQRSFGEAALFGEASVSPAPDWRVAIGARLSAVRIGTDIQAAESGGRTASDRNGASVRVTPSVSARWDVTPSATVFARFEQAVRPAGVSEAGGAFARYQGDRVTLTELGVRSRGRAGFSGEISIGSVDWRDVQADIVTQSGDLVTDNVGDGVLRFVSVKTAWTPVETLNLSGGFFVNDSRLTATRFSVIGPGRTDIPNVAPVGAQLSLNYAAGQLAGAPLRLGADLRYIGQSRLGVGPGLDVPQGGYLRTELTARLGGDRRAATLRISNPLNVAEARYGIGSPYQLSEPQIVPVRPLTVRLTFESAF